MVHCANEPFRITLRKPETQCGSQSAWCFYARVGDLLRDAAGLLSGDLVPAWKHAAYQSRPGRRRFASTTQSYIPMLREINPHAGAVDVGSEHFHAAVYGGPLEVFGTFTRDLERVKEFFQKHGVETVAMEATGVSGGLFLAWCISLQPW